MATIAIKLAVPHCLSSSIVFSFSKVLEQKEQLEQKHLHLLQILDSERQAKWHYVQQTEELTSEVKKLKNEVRPSANQFLIE